MDYRELINSKPLGSIERLDLIASYGNKQQSDAAKRCIIKRIKKMNDNWLLIKELKENFEL